MGERRGRRRGRRLGPGLLIALGGAGLAVGAAGAFMVALLRVHPARSEPINLKQVTAAAVACDFTGWSNDPDPGGLPIRQNPEPASPSLGRLPPSKVIGADEFAVVVHVIGYRDGWFRIDQAAFPAEAYPSGGNTGRPVFSGQGWVPAPMIKATLGADVLRTSPRNDAPRKASLRGVRGGFPMTPDGVGVRRLVSCQGSWVEAETEFGLGWVSRVCAKQLEGC